MCVLEVYRCVKMLNIALVGCGSTGSPLPLRLTCCGEIPYRTAPYGDFLWTIDDKENLLSGLERLAYPPHPTWTRIINP